MSIGNSDLILRDVLVNLRLLLGVVALNIFMILRVIEVCSWISCDEGGLIRDPLLIWAHLSLTFVIFDVAIDPVLIFIL